MKKSLWKKKKNWARLVTLAALALLIWQYFAAVNFPTREPVKVVDAELVEYLRDNPGLHLALARDFTFQVSLDLESDSVNKLLFGTEVEVRENRADRAIHIQHFGTSGAIHTDRYNPQAGPWYWLLHNSLEVYTVPLLLVLLTGLYFSFPSRDLS